MKTDPQHLLSAHVPFYRRRLFWGVIFGIFFIFSTVLFIDFLDKDGGDYTHSVKQIFGNFNIAYGSTIFTMLGFKIGAMFGYIGSVIYFTLMTYLTYKTFQKICVLLKYPIILSILYITGIMPVLLLSTF